jgi:hypothetical protein
LLFYAVKSNEIIEKMEVEKQYFGAGNDPKKEAKKTIKTL